MDVLQLPTVDPLSICQFGWGACTTILSSPQRFNQVQVRAPAATATSKLQKCLVQSCLWVLQTILFTSWLDFCSWFRLTKHPMTQAQLNFHRFFFMDCFSESNKKNRSFFSLNKMRKNERTWIFFECAVCLVLASTGLPCLFCGWVGHLNPKVISVFMWESYSFSETG